MPNWVRNIVIPRNPEEFLKDTRGENDFDLNKIIPMPEDLNITSGSSSWMGSISLGFADESRKKFQKKLEELLKNVYTDNMMQAEFVAEALGALSKAGLKEETAEQYRCYRTKEDERVIDESSLENVLKGYFNQRRYGSTDWYGWCCDNWGTKWNTSEVREVNGVIYFDTAWSCPDGVYDALVKKHDFVVIYADEDIGSNFGVFVAKNGQFFTDGFDRQETTDLEDYVFANLVWSDGNMEYFESSEIYRENQETCDRQKMLFDRFRNYKEWEE